MSEMKAVVCIGCDKRVTDGRYVECNVCHCAVCYACDPKCPNCIGKEELLASYCSAAIN